MAGGEAGFFAGFLDGALQSLVWCAVGFSAWWVMFRAPLGRRTFRTSLKIAASPERIWSLYFLEPSPAGGWSGALEISRQGFAGEPPERHHAFVRHGGAGPFRESVWEVLDCKPFALYAGEQISIEGERVEAADVVTTRLRLTPQVETSESGTRQVETLIEHETRRVMRGIFGHLYAPRANRRFLEHFRVRCEGGGENAMHGAIVSRPASLLLAILAFVAIVAVFSAGNPELVELTAFIAFFLQVAIWLHEYGHVLAMRWFGHSEATLVLVPFLGGAAINARHPATRFEDAVVALMGPALSGAIVLALTPFVPRGLYFFAPDSRAEILAWSHPEALSIWVGLGAIAFLAMAIPINLYNLVPVGMLDGGRVVSALARGRVVQALLASAIFAAIAFAFAGSAGAKDFGAALAFVGVVWVVGLLTAENAGEELAPMNGRETFAALALLVVTLAVYVDASRSLTPTFLSALKASIDSRIDPAFLDPARPDGM